MKKKSVNKPRSKAITIPGTLADHKFTIIAEPDAWVALKDRVFGNYQYMKRGALFKEVWPFIFEALLEVYKPKRAYSKSHYRKVIQSDSASIYKHLRKAYPEKKADDLIWETRGFVEQVWRNELKHFKLTLGDEDSFKSHYLTPGRKILNGDGVFKYHNDLRRFSFLTFSLLSEKPKVSQKNPRVKKSIRQMAD